MQGPWPDQPFAVQVRQAAERRGLSLRTLARASQIDPGHLSRVLRRAAGKKPGLELMQAVAQELELDPAAFPEYRAEVIRRRVSEDPEVRDRLFSELSRLD
jgi:transcriptional regulator with XRE-family HTH domain